MLIKVESDFVDKVLSSRDSKLVDVLHRLLWALHFGKHAVFFETKDYDRIISFRELSPMEIGSVKKIKKLNYRIKSILSDTKIICHVTINDKTYRDNKDIFINPEETGDFEYQTETHLITENLSDSEFFVRYIVPYYQRTHKTHHISICTFRIMGGGDTMGKVVKQEVDLGEHFALAITDSDKKYPKHNKEGETSKKVRVTLGEPELIRFNCGRYVLQNVMEIENLLPWKYVSANKQLHGKEVITNNYLFRDLAYFDMKDGLSTTYIDDTGFNTYWQENIIDEDLRTRFENETRKESCSTVVAGLGDAVLTQTEQLMDEANEIIESTDLTDYQKREWENIGSIITSWCCCFGKMRS